MRFKNVIIAILDTSYETIAQKQEYWWNARYAVYQYSLNNYTVKGIYCNISSGSNIIAKTVQQTSSNVSTLEAYKNYVASLALKEKQIEYSPGIAASVVAALASAPNNLGMKALIVVCTAAGATYTVASLLCWEAYQLYENIFYTTFWG